MNDVREDEISTDRLDNVQELENERSSLQNEV